MVTRDLPAATRHPPNLIRKTTSLEVNPHGPPHGYMYANNPVLHQKRLYRSADMSRNPASKDPIYEL